VDRPQLDQLKILLNIIGMLGARRQILDISQGPYTMFLQSLSMTDNALKGDRSYATGCRIHCDL
jgi:hypothetical protein